MANDGLTRKVRRLVRRQFGLWPVLEWRNRIFMAHAVPRLTRTEDAEVRRLLAMLGQRPKATVACVIPTYKRPEQLKLAVASVLRQEYRDFVAIVVEDGDFGLPELPRDPRLFTVSLSRNTGVLGLVRNIGIRLTDSRYIAFLDDDNMWSPLHLRLAVEALNADSDFVYTALRRRMPTGEEFDVISRHFDRRKLMDDMNFIDSNSIVLRRSAGTLFSRLPRVRSTMPKEDWEFAYRQTRNVRVKHITEPTVEYLINVDSYFTRWMLEEREDA